MTSVRGFVLLEVMVSLVVLSIAGLALLELYAGSVHLLTRAQEREQTFRDLDRLMTANVLLSKADFVRRNGVAAVGPYLIEIRRAGPNVFSIVGSAAGGTVTLRTTVVRGER